MWGISSKEHRICIDTCMTSNFQTKEWSIYKQAIDAEATQDWWG